MGNTDSLSIKVPKNIKDLKIRHVDIFNELEESEYTSINDKVKVVSRFSGVPINDIKNYNANDIRKVFDLIVKCFSTYKQNSLPEFLEYENVIYEKVKEFSRMPIGWYIDLDVADVESNPSLLASFCYIEKGFDYASKDKHKNIKNPLFKRAEVFERNMPLNLYLDIAGFFLLKQKQYKKSLELIRAGKARREKESVTNGKI